MVVINKQDQDKVTQAIEHMEHELRLLCVLLGNVAHRSDDQGFLEAGDIVEIVKAMPGSVPKVKCAVVMSVEYRIKGLKVCAEGNTSEGMQIVTNLDMKQMVMRKVTGKSGGRRVTVQSFIQMRSMARILIKGH